MTVVAPHPDEWTNADLMGLAAGMIGWKAADPVEFGRGRSVPRQFGEQGLRGVVVLVVDGLGWHQLRGCGVAPLLEDAASRQDPIRAVLPSTTVTNLASIGTGREGGDHGLLGYTMVMPDGSGAPVVFNPLVWRFGLRGRGEDARSHVVPEALAPRPTMLERFADDGVSTTVVLDPAFLDSGLTRAGLRGGQRVAVQGLAATLDRAVAAVATVDGPAVAYCHHGRVDMVGHLDGPLTPMWREAVAEVDRCVADVVATLPDDVGIVVTADHGMVTIAPDDVVEVPARPGLLEGVALVAGEPRMRTLVVAPGVVAATVADRWAEAVGDWATVMETPDAVAQGWFGSNVPADHAARLGDIVIAVHRGSLSHPRVDAYGGRLTGMHGAMTAAERDIPALVLQRE